MVVYSKLTKFILILTLFNIFFSYINQKSESKILYNINEDPLLFNENNLKIKTKVIEENSITTFNLTTEDQIILKLNHKGNSSKDRTFILVTSLNGTKFKTKLSNSQEEFNNSHFKKDFNSSNIPDISLSTNISTFVEIISVVNHSYALYTKIKEEKDKEIEIKKNNFVIFLKKDTKKIKVDIKFNKKYNGTIYYGIVKLATDNNNYIPLACNFENINNKSINSDEVNFELQNNYNKKKDPKKYTALIFSIKDEIKNYKYTIIINRSMPMDLFLIIFIGVSVLLAIITFFLIRRKKNIENNNNCICEDEYEED